MQIFRNTRYKGNYNGSERYFTISQIYFKPGLLNNWEPDEYDLLQDGEEEPKRVKRQKLIDWIENKILVRVWN